MVSKPMTVRAALVALLAEGVDRNSPFAALRGYDEQVALLTEGVDRNTVKNVPGPELGRRPPHGGRG